MSLKRDRCLDCDAPVSGSFCSQCGQRNADYRVSFGEVLRDALDGVFQIDSRIGRTVLPFLFRPGFLTREYNAGRRTRYSSPLRIYLLLSVLYFFALSFLPVNDKLRFGNPGDGKSGVHVESSIAIDGSENKRASERDPEVHIGWARLERHITHQLNMLKRMDPAEARRRAQESFLSQASKGLFFLLPVFALLLKLLYRKTGHFYIEHLTFSLHLHAFVLFMLLLCLLPRISDHVGIIALLCYGHLLVALRTVYAQGWLRTFGKSLFLLALYSFALLFGVVFMAIWTLIVI